MLQDPEPKGFKRLVKVI